MVIIDKTAVICQEDEGMHNEQPSNSMLEDLLYMFI